MMRKLAIVLCALSLNTWASGFRPEPEPADDFVHVDAATPVISVDGDAADTLDEVAGQKLTKEEAKDPVEDVVGTTCPQINNSSVYLSSLKAGATYTREAAFGTITRFSEAANRFIDRYPRAVSTAIAFAACAAHHYLTCSPLAMTEAGSQVVLSQATASGMAACAAVQAVACSSSAPAAVIQPKQTEVTQLVLPVGSCRTAMIRNYGKHRVSTRIWNVEEICTQFKIWISAHPGANLLHFAASKSYEGNLEDIVDADYEGADVDALDDEQNTPLMYAAALEKIDVIEILLARGANPAIKNKFGSTALSIAKARRYSNVVALLEKHGAIE